jgi:Protein of unknown function (DUF2852)
MHHHALLWPLGLVLLGFFIGSGRMACWAHAGADRWQRRIERMQRRLERMQAAAERWGEAATGPRAGIAHLTNTAPRPCAVSKKSSASSRNFSTGCATPRTKRNSTNSWRTAAAAQAMRDRSRKPPDQRSRSFGSSTSRKASPKILTPNTVSMIARPGKIAIHGAVVAYSSAPPCSISPQAGTGSCTPRPR